MAAPPPTDKKPQVGIPARIWLPLAIAVAITMAIFVLSEMSYREFTDSRGRMGDGLSTRALLLQLEKAVLDAESAQRGYLLTNHEEYLAPYRSAVARIQPLQTQLRDAFFDDKGFRDSMAQVTELIALKLAEMDSTVTAARAGDTAKAREIVDGDKGRALMTRIRDLIVQIDTIISRRVDRQGADWDSSIETNRTAIFTVVGLNIVLIGGVVLLLIRETRQRNELMHIVATHADTLVKEVAERTAELSSLSAFLQTNSERERAELARELHDELGAILTPAKMDVDVLTARLAGQPDFAVRLERLRLLLEEGIDVKRRIIENLRPSLLDHLGLGPALHWHVQETCKAANLECRLNVAQSLERLTPDLEIALYRIVQEGLTNVIKHAKAKSVDFTVERAADGVRVVMVDDGEGIADLGAANHLAHGLTGMRHRAMSINGRFEIRSAPGKGTAVEVFIPLPQSHFQAAVSPS